MSKMNTNDKPDLSRRAWLGVAVGGAATVLVGGRWWSQAHALASPAAPSASIKVYASPGCQCCHRWVSHLEQNAFTVTVEKVDDVTPYKKQFGVPEKLWSCHTGVVDGYTVEGHVPADVIRKMLTERPDIVGISAPGMPSGSPGMEGPVKDKYDIVAFRKNGETQVYASR